MFRSIINPLYASILVSLLSGVGLVLVLAIAPPTKETYPPTNNTGIYAKQPLSKKLPNLEVDPEKEEPLQEPTKDKFIPIDGSSRLPFSLPKPQYSYSAKTIAFNRLGSSPMYDQGTYPDYYYSIQEPRLSIKTVSRPLLHELSFTRMYRPESFYAKQEEIRALNISYSLSQNVSAQVRSSIMDFSTEVQTQRVNMAGIHFSSGKQIATKFFAGSATTLPAYHIPNYTSFTEKNYYRNGMNAGNRMFEWQTILTPSKYFGLETSLYNLDMNQNAVDPQGKEGAKVSVFFGMKFLLVNLKYNYLTNDLLGSINQVKASTNASTDFATLGLTLFLDKSKQYSLYLGNQYHNIATPINTIRTTQIPGSNSFTAMFRGKSEHLFNSTFFVNFRNQSYKDLIFSNIGVYRLPIYSQSSLEYATALGLELNW